MIRIVHVLELVREVNQPLADGRPGLRLADQSEQGPTSWRSRRLPTIRWVCAARPAIEAGPASQGHAAWRSRESRLRASRESTPLASAGDRSRARTSRLAPTVSRARTAHVAGEPARLRLGQAWAPDRARRASMAAALCSTARPACALISSWTPANPLRGRASRNNVRGTNGAAIDLTAETIPSRSARSWNCRKPGCAAATARGQWESSARLPRRGRRAAILRRLARCRAHRHLSPALAGQATTCQPRRRRSLPSA